MSVIHDGADVSWQPDYESEASEFFERLRARQARTSIGIPVDLTQQATISNDGRMVMVSTPTRPVSIMDVAEDATDRFTREQHQLLERIQRGEGEFSILSRPYNTVRVDESDESDRLDLLNNLPQPISNAVAGTSGPNTDAADALHHAMEVMRNSPAIPQDMMVPAVRPMPHLPFTVSSEVTRPWIMTSNELRFDSVHVNNEFRFLSASTGRTPQEQHVRELPADKALAVEKLVQEALPPQEMSPIVAEQHTSLVKLAKAFYLGYLEGKNGSHRDVNESLYNTMRQAIGRWHGVLSVRNDSDKPGYIMSQMFRNNADSLTLEKLNAIKNGTNPFTAAPPVVSDDIVKRFIIEMAGMLNAKIAVLVMDMSSNLEGGSAPRGGARFTTGDVTLTDEGEDIMVGPVALGKFDVSVNIYDFGLVCGNEESGVNDIVRISAQTPVYPRNERGGFVHPHVEGSRLCFGNGLAVAGNLVRAGLIADLFQYVERILMTYGSSPYIDLSEWTDLDHCSVCSATIQPDDAYHDPHSGRDLCEECVGHCDIGNTDVDRRYIRHCSKCNLHFDERSYYGRVEEERRRETRFICLRCVEKEQVEAAKLAAEIASKAMDTTTTPAFPVVAPTPGKNCPSCGASIGEVVVNPDGSVVVENKITGYDPIMQVMTCDHCDPAGYNLSNAVCTPGMREAYLATLMAHYVPHDFIQDIFINNEESFESEADKAEWRAIDWYTLLTTFRNNLMDHGPLRQDMAFAAVIDKLCELAEYNIFSELTYRLATPRTA